MNEKLTKLDTTNLDQFNKDTPWQEIIGIIHYVLFCKHLKWYEDHTKNELKFMHKAIDTFIEAFGVVEIEGVKLELTRVNEYDFVSFTNVELAEAVQDENGTVSVHGEQGRKVFPDYFDLSLVQRRAVDAYIDTLLHKNRGHD